MRSAEALATKLVGDFFKAAVEDFRVADEHLEVVHRREEELEIFQKVRLVNEHLFLCCRRLTPRHHHLLRYHSAV